MSLPSTCTVIIPTRDRPEALQRCLAAVQAQHYPGLEVMVVDSASRHAAEVRAIAQAAGARYLRLPRPGASRARNAGARAAMSEFVLFFDDDTEPQPGCIAAMMAEFADGQVAAVNARALLPGSGEAETAFASYSGFDAGPDRRVLDRDTPDWFEQTNFGALGVGAAVSYRRSVFEDWPGYDERLGRGAPQDCNEESYAFFTLVERGHRVVYCPQAVVRHPAPRSMKELRRRHLREMAWSAAYMTLLLVEHASYRRTLLRYAWEGLRGKPRAWRSRPAAARYAVIPKWRERLAWMAGPLLYARMRLLVAAGLAGKRA